jgi:beta-phosphoglucomutase-like phosphatase (HAD superfamily)
MALMAIIFDVDGTLAETEDTHRKAFNQAFERSLTLYYHRAAVTQVTGSEIPAVQACHAFSIRAFCAPPTLYRQNHG